MKFGSDDAEVAAWVALYVVVSLAALSFSCLLIIDVVAVIY